MAGAVDDKDLSVSSNQGNAQLSIHPKASLDIFATDNIGLCLAVRPNISKTKL